MAEVSEMSSAMCADLIKATEDALKGPQLKSLLCCVWGQNICRTAFWAFY